MTEHTDKASRKAGKAASKGQRGKGRSPKSKRAKSPDGKTVSGKPSGSATPADKNGVASDACLQTGQAKAPASPAAKSPEPKPPASKSPEPKSPEPKSPEPKSLAPDPATVTFGRNRPIVAAPRKLPESSGLRFTGPSLGKLKASGPQRSSAKASGLTFASVKSTNGQGTGSSKPAAYGPAPRRAENAKAEPAKSALKKNGPVPAGPAAAGVRKAETAAPSSRVPPSGTKTPGKNIAKPAPLTKPAIAPQASIRRLEKERSFSGFVLTLLGLLVTVGALAFWMNSGPNTLPHTPVAQDQAAPGEQVASATRSAAIPAAKTEEPAPVNFGPSVRAPVSPGPLVAAPSTTAPESAPGFTTDLSLEQIAEVQQLLDRLGLVPGNLDGILTAETQEAIRDYQEMAGLPADGGADMALLEELRTVAELYGS